MEVKLVQQDGSQKFVTKKVLSALYINGEQDEYFTWKRKLTRCQ